MQSDAPLFSGRVVPRFRSLREEKGVDLRERAKSLHDYEGARAEAGSLAGREAAAESSTDESASPAAED